MADFIDDAADCSSDDECVHEYDRQYCIWCNEPEEQATEEDLQFIDDEELSEDKAEWIARHQAMSWTSPSPTLETPPPKETKQERRRRKLQEVEERAKAARRSSASAKTTKTTVLDLSKESDEDSWTTPPLPTIPSKTEGGPTRSETTAPPLATASKTSSSSTSSESPPAASTIGERSRSASGATTTVTSATRSAASHQDTAVPGADSATADGPRRFKLRCKQLFVTFPQCQTPKETVMDNIKVFFSNLPHKLEQAMVVRELHEDGQPHLHALIILDRVFETRDPHKLDRLSKGEDGQCKHGNYDTVRHGIRAAVEYLTKEDPFPVLFNMDLQKILAKKKTKISDDVKKAIDTGVSMLEIMDTFGGFVLLHLRHIKEYQVERARQLSRVPRFPDGAATPTWATDTNTMEAQRILAWINAEIFHKDANGVRTERPRKQKQLWLHGPPDTGKTGIIMTLAETIRVGWAPMEKGWWDEFEDGAFDLIVFDEFKGGWPIRHINSIVEGVPFHMRRRNGDGMKLKNTPVIITSNFDPYGCYSNLRAEEVDPTMARFTVIKIETFTSIKLVQE